MTGLLIINSIITKIFIEQPWIKKEFKAQFMCLLSLGKQGQGNQCQTLEVILEEKDGKK